VVFLPPDFLLADFFPAVFRDDFFFGGGTFSPDCLASLSAIAMACFGFFTLRLPPDFNWPCLYSCMTLPTFLRAPGDSFRDDFEAVFFAAVFLPALFFFAAMLSLPGTKGRRDGLPFLFNATLSPSWPLSLQPSS
jgi:hypothetical protein